MTSRFSDSPNARSKSITIADLDTHGVLNRHSVNHPTFQVGVSEDKGTRRTMEDAHSFVVDFDSIRGQGFFAVFDGHAGKHAAEWCGSHFHEYLLAQIHGTPTMPIPDLLNQTFHAVDAQLSKMCEESDGKIHSGCTAVTAFLRVEDTTGQQSFIITSVDSPPTDSSMSGILEDDSAAASAAVSSSENEHESIVSPKASKKSKKKSLSGSRIRNALRSLGAGSSSSKHSPPATSSPSPPGSHKSTGVTMIVPPGDHRRVLYSANAGDARGVLCRGGKAVRLTYDHKGSDKQEAKRITDAGGFVMSGRVNGVLAVTRSLGDSSMKEFVVGAPYTTETELCDEDEFLILACDGLWDIINDQPAVDLVREIEDAQVASETLLKHALEQHTTDNVTVLVVRFKHPRLHQDIQDVTMESPSTSVSRIA
ncbi:phosphatase 2C-domain-containing protein [Ephemerocybe angulata]|uniref:Phosphatase 2C-domain-containing protein n=1 Tax=Ephemerocybe angulata TaxID=980116 RepID=A0A8H6I9F2_9AGAR|nr:phosphatase 2C-domain-containing protein [Tulosesus angulatus]